MPGHRASCMGCSVCDTHRIYLYTTAYTQCRLISPLTMIDGIWRTADSKEPASVLLEVIPTTNGIGIHAELNAVCLTYMIEW